MTKSACIGKEEGGPLLLEPRRGCRGCRSFWGQSGANKEIMAPRCVYRCMDGGREAAVAAENLIPNV